MVQLIVASFHELQLRNLKLLVETGNRFIIAGSSVEGENLPIASSSSGDKMENQRNHSENESRSMFKDCGRSR